MKLALSSGAVDCWYAQKAETGPHQLPPAPASTGAVMGAADPSYPLLPIANILCAACLFLLLIVNFLRRAHVFNVAVNLLSFCLFWETLFNGIGMIVWSDNAEIKAYTFCDVGEESTRDGAIRDLI